jgi:hypothetical protein
VGLHAGLGETMLADRVRICYPNGRKVSRMETLRLRSLQNPSHVGRMLESLVAGVTLVPGTCQQVHDSDALPLRLRALVSRALEEGRVWACWMDAHESHLFTCEMSLGQSRARRAGIAGEPIRRPCRTQGVGNLAFGSGW